MSNTCATSSLDDVAAYLPTTCDLCPRACGANRARGERGYCGADNRVLVARCALHFWEEPPLSGSRGSGAIFFSNCAMRCLFCQNHQISAEGFGAQMSVFDLASAMVDLQSQGAHNINLVTATHYAPVVFEALAVARRQGLKVPCVYNTSAYETQRAIDTAANHVDIWLPDYKYADPVLANRFSKAPDYPAVSLSAIGRMVEVSGARDVDDEGIMRSGVIVRHLVLPGHVDDSMVVLSKLWETFGNKIDVSVMSQYTPPTGGRVPKDAPELGETLDRDDYESVLDWADMLGFEHLWWQMPGAEKDSFIPDFDLTGVSERGEC